jgi:RNA polymerase sigma factor (sigma-70 family)
VSRTDPASATRLEAARAGDAVAWSHLYHELAPLVLGYLRAQRLADAEDVAGEVMLEVVRDLQRFQGDAANLRSWVLSIAHHRLIDERRRSQRRPTTIGEPTADGPYASTEAGPEETTIASEGLSQLAPALASLTEDQRTVLLLRVIGDLPIAEVARITGKRPGAVKQLQRRAAASMRRALDAPASGTSRHTEQDPRPISGHVDASLVPMDGHADGR